MSADKPASAKLKARQPRGFVDRGPAEVAATERMLAVIRESFAVHGFEPVETPFVEYTDALGALAGSGPAERGRLLLPGR